MSGFPEDLRQNELFPTVRLGEAPRLIERRETAMTQQTSHQGPPLLELAHEQAAALDAVLAFVAEAKPREFFTVHGLAGTGKTVILATLARHLMAESGRGVMLAAPTGKAATVLAGKTGMGVSTLHKLLYAPPDERDGRLTWSKAWPPGSLARSVVLLDEASMVDRELAGDLLETGAVVLPFGDPGQLWPVKGLPFFTHADFELTEIRRQAADSPIIRQAHLVRLGQPYHADGGAFQVVDRADFREHAKWADIVLCWKNETRLKANRIMRRQLGIPDNAPPQAGEPIMILRNAPWIGLMNGEITTVVAYQQADELCGKLTTDGGQRFDVWLGDEDDAPRRRIPVALAYAITTHKSQGSEWPNVLIMNEFEGHELDRARWLYTAITRASNAVRIVLPRGVAMVP